MQTPKALSASPESMPRTHGGSPLALCARSQGENLAAAGGPLTLCLQPTGHARRTDADERRERRALQVRNFTGALAATIAVCRNSQVSLSAREKKNELHLLTPRQLLTCGDRTRPHTAEHSVWCTPLSSEGRSLNATPHVQSLQSEKTILTPLIVRVRPRTA